MTGQQPDLSIHYDLDQDNWGIRASNPDARPGPWISDQRWRTHEDAWQHKQDLLSAARSSQ